MQLRYNFLVSTRFGNILWVVAGVFAAMGFSPQALSLNEKKQLASSSEVVDAPSFLELCKRLNARMHPDMKETLYSLFPDLKKKGTNCAKIWSQHKDTMAFTGLPRGCKNAITHLRPLLFFSQLQELSLEQEGNAHCEREIRVEDWSPLKQMKLKKFSLIRQNAHGSGKPDGYLSNAEYLPESLESLVLRNHLSPFSFSGLERLQQLTQWELQMDWRDFRLSPPYPVLKQLRSLTMDGFPVMRNTEGHPVVLDTSVIEWLLVQPELSEISIGSAPVNGVERFLISEGDKAGLLKKTNLRKFHLNGKEVYLRGQ